MSFRRSLLALSILLISATAGSGQKLNPIKWSLTVEPSSVAPGGRFLARFIASIDPGWHLYSLSTPKGGPIPTTIQLASPSLSSSKIYQPKPERRFDRNFNLDTETYDKEAVFIFDAVVGSDVAPGPLEVSAQARFQACDDKMCLPPRKAGASAALIIDRSAAASEVSLPPGYTEFDPSKRSAAVPSRPVTPPAQADTAGLGAFLLIAFGFGLAAIFTPCVFPMIPITVSYFLNKPAGNRGQSVLEAALFCAGIIVLFSGLGLLATVVLGPFGIVQLGSNIWVNSFIALVFLAFGLSLLGAFEITIPSSVLTGLDRVSQRGGLIGTLLMGLTFSLTAFACVGPFVGTLLAASVQSGGARPVMGMVAFATGLASPFFFLALFPAYLKRVPKSGGWLERVKVVMGFIILAAMFKYISAVDQVMQWNVLTRERFLAVWIALFTLAGLYLLGFLRLRGTKPDEAVGLTRVLAGGALLAFALSLIPGMFGSRLGELDAYVPPPTASGFGSSDGSSSSTGPVWMKNQYREALHQARRENKHVLVAFTGYACTNCHWMKANMFTRPEVAAAMGGLVPVELYTDGTDDASEQNQKLQESRFATVAIPYYVILDPEEKVIATSPGLTRDAKQFIAFLRSRPS